MTVATTASKITHQVSGWLARTAVGRLAGRSIASLVRVEVFDRAMTLAAQAFTSILPIVVAVAAFNPSNADQLGGTLAEQLGLTADASRVLEGSLPDGATVQRSLGVVGLVLILLSSTSFSRALERMYARVWEVDRAGFRGAWRWLACLLAIVLAVFLLRFTQRAVDGTSYEAEIGILVQLVIWAVVWTFVPWLLLVRKVPRRTLWAGGVITAVALSAVSVAGSVYLPRALTASARQFGALGLSITFIGWLFVIFFAVILGTVVGFAAAHDEGRLGTIVRGTSLQ